MKRRAIASEYQEQKAIFDWRATAVKRWPELALLHSTQSGVRTSIGAAVKAKKAGMPRGLPDLMLPIARHVLGDKVVRCKHGLWIELKRPSGGRTSKEQDWWMNELRIQGYVTRVCYGADEAIRTIMDYLEWKL